MAYQSKEDPSSEKEDQTGAKGSEREGTSLEQPVKCGAGQKG